MLPARESHSKVGKTLDTQHFNSAMFPHRGDHTQECAAIEPSQPIRVGMDYHRFISISVHASQRHRKSCLAGRNEDAFD
jgi:hypothetical protein